jgi:hypothetical protein
MPRAAPNADASMRPSASIVLSAFFRIWIRAGGKIFPTSISLYFLCFLWKDEKGLIFSARGRQIFPPRACRAVKRHDVKDPACP